MHNDLLQMLPSDQLQKCCCIAGRQFQDLPFYFPDGIVFGLVNHNSRKVKMNPAPTTVVEAGDEVLIVRPTNLPGGSYQPAVKPAIRDTGTCQLASLTSSHASDDVMQAHHVLAQMICLLAAPALSTTSLPVPATC